MSMTFHLIFDKYISFLLSPQEETQLMSDVVKLEEKLKSIKEVIASKRIKMEEKRTLVEALETMPLKKVNVPVFPDFSSS